MLTSRDPRLVERVGVLSLHGMSSGAWNRYSARGSWFYEIDEPGYKCNMGDIQAALGLRQLDSADEFRRRREAIARIYVEELGSEEAVKLPVSCDNGTHAWHLYPVQVDLQALTIDRDAFIRALKSEGVGTSVHFIPIHYHAYYSRHLDYGPGSFPVAEEFFSRAISLPIYPSMTDSDARDVATALRRIANYYRR